MAEELISVDLGAASTPDFEIPENWSVPDGDRRWARGDVSAITRPKTVAHDGNIYVFLTVDPPPGSTTEQTIRIIVDDEVRRTLSFDTRITFGFSVRNDAASDGRGILFKVEHPVVDPSADRALGFANMTLARQPKARPTLTVAPVASSQDQPLPDPSSLSNKELMNRFVSLGDNCEFGLAQRSFDADPMDMLRFGGIQYAGLLRGLECDFERIDSVDDIFFKKAGTEYIFVHRRFGLEMHTLLFAGKTSPTQLFHAQLAKLFIQRRLLMEDLFSSRRIFVYKQNYPISDADTMQLLERLRAKAPNTLLSVVLADDRHPPGTVQRLRNGLLRGYIDWFSPYDDAAGARSDYWLTICRNAFRLWVDEANNNALTARSLTA